MIIISAWITVPTIAPIPACPVTLTFGPNDNDANHQEKDEAQSEQKGAGSRAEMLQEGWERRQPCKRRGHQDMEMEDRRDTGEEERVIGTCQG